MVEMVVLLFLGVCIALMCAGIYYMLHWKGYNYSSHALAPVCQRGIYALCFSEGYIILTESYEDAQRICADLHLEGQPYWSQIVHTYPNAHMANACYREIEQYIGTSVSSFVSFMQDGRSLCFQGYVSAIRKS